MLSVFGSDLSRPLQCGHSFCVWSGREQGCWGSLSIHVDVGASSLAALLTKGRRKVNPDVDHLKKKKFPFSKQTDIKSSNLW